VPRSRLDFFDPGALIKLAEGIRRIGFRKWYERELLRGHAHLVLLLLCAIGVIAALEAVFRFRTINDQLLNLVAVLGCAAVGIWAVRRYLYLLHHAEMIANQADCPHCKTYGRLDLIAADDAHARVRVRCRQCTHEWSIEG
jgi:hypothetical protein